MEITTGSRSTKVELDRKGTLVTIKYKDFHFSKNDTITIIATSSISFISFRHRVLSIKLKDENNPISIYADEDQDEQLKKLFYYLSEVL